MLWLHCGGASHGIVVVHTISASPAGNLLDLRGGQILEAGDTIILGKRVKNNPLDFTGKRGAGLVARSSKAQRQNHIQV